MNEGNSFKAKITTTLGTFEFEGTEDFVVKQVAGVLERAESSTKQPNPQGGQPGGAKSGAGTTSKRPSGEQPKMIPSLIIGKEKLDSLRAFYEQKQPTNHMETFAVLTHWLSNELQMTDVSIDEMWTLYKVLQVRPPKVLVQTFRDGKSKKAFFDVSSTNGRYFLTSFGETFVEHDLPKITEGKKG